MVRDHAVVQACLNIDTVMILDQELKVKVESMGNAFIIYNFHYFVVVK